MRTILRTGMTAAVVWTTVSAWWAARWPAAGAANVLAVTLHDARSHFVAFEPLLVRLMAAGHNVTVVGHVRPRETPAGVTYRYVALSGDPSESDGRVGRVPISVAKRTTLAELRTLRAVGARYARFVRNDQLRRLVDGAERFDLVIAETFVSRLALALVDRLGAPPFILVSSTDLFPHTACNLATCLNPAHELWPHSGLFDRTAFARRLQNAAEMWVWTLWLNLVMDADSQTMAGALSDRWSPPSSPPSLKRIERRASLVLLSSHFSFGNGKSLPPNVVEVGGLAVGQPRALPSNIREFMDGAEDGVVYFCMGSLLRGSSFPKEKRDAFLYAFSKLPQRVLWKWEGDELPGRTDNIMISKWMPQRDILAHPNVKLFVSHGGLLGTSEAVYEGVPILGIPIFGDQRTNVKAVEANGAGQLLDYDDISNETVLEKIRNILTNPEYQRKADQVSARYRDRPMSPLDTAVYWTEYVIRHKGAPHLRTAAVDMPWYEYLLLDVLAAVVGLLVAALLLFYGVARLAFVLLVRLRRLGAATATATTATATFKQKRG